MPSKRRKKNELPQTCPNCKEVFDRLNTHFYHKPVCQEWVLNNDKTVVSDINSLNIDKEKQVTSSDRNINNHLQLTTFDYHHTNDPDAMLFEFNNICMPCATLPENNDDFVHFEDEESVSSKNSGNSNNELSICSDKLHQTDTNETNMMLCDYQIQTLMTSTTEHTTKQSQTDTSIPPCFIDFRSYQTQVYNQMIHLPIDQATISSIKLLKLMLNGLIPSCYYQSIIDWHNETLLATSRIDCRSTVSLIKSKKNVISFLHNIMYAYISPSLSMKPIHDIIVLPSLQSTRISKMNLLGSLFSLLTDPELMVESNLLINDPTFTKPNETLSTHINDIHHSSSFRYAHSKFCTNEMDVLVPIIPFIDGTPIDPYGRNKLEVFMYTLGIFNQSTRNKPSSWHVAGYIPDPTNSNSGEHDVFEHSQFQKQLQSDMIIMQC